MAKSYAIKKGIVALLLLFPLLAFSQLSGTITIPVNYPSLLSVLGDLNSNGAASGGVTIQLQEGYTETAPSGGFVLTASGTSTGPITIKGLGTTLPQLTASGAQVAGSTKDAILKLVGSDFVVIQDIIFKENSGNTITPTATNKMTEFGIALFYASATNGCQHVTIRRNEIQLNSAYANNFGIYSNSTHSAADVSTTASATGSNGGNHFLSITNNKISAVNQGIMLVGAASASAFTNSTVIRSNEISNFGFSTIVAGTFANVTGGIAGIALRNINSVAVTDNQLTSSAGIANAGSLRGIYIATPSASATQTVSDTIKNNSIALNHGANGSIAGIDIETSSISATSNLIIDGNTLKELSHSVVANQAVSGIQNAARALNQKINNNKFENLVITSSGNFRFISNTTALPSNGSKTISSNAIVGTFMKQTAGGTVSFYLDNGTSPSGTTVINSNNNFSNVQLTGNTTLEGWRNSDGNSTGDGPTKTISSNTFENIQLGGGRGAILTISNGADVTIENNQIESISNTGNSVTHTLQGISISGNIPQLTIQNNTLSTLENSGTNGAVEGISLSSQPVELNVSDNEISNIIGSGSSTVSGISLQAIGAVSGSKASIFSNQLSNLQGSNFVKGIELKNGESIQVYQNSITGLKSLGANTNMGALQGISASDVQIKTLEIYTNLMGDFSVEAANNALSVIGINNSLSGTGSTCKVYFNSILLNAASSGTDFGSTVIYQLSNASATVGNLDVRNNVLLNLSTPSGSGIVSVYERSGNELANFSNLTDRNLIYAGASSSDHVLMKNGIETYLTLSGYQGLTSREGNSISDEGFDFLNAGEFFESVTAGASGYLKPIETIVSGINNGGVNITNPSITTDFSGVIRAGNPGYLGIGSAPDMGAYEFPKGEAKIKVSGNGQLLVSGQTATSTANFTQFTSVLACNGTSTRNFDIENIGTAALLIQSIVVGGLHPNDFAATVQEDTLLPGNTTTLTVTFDPGVISNRQALISFNTNDPNQMNFTFGISGSGLQDNVAPVPNLTNLPMISSTCSVTLVPPTAADNCSGTLAATTTSPLTISTEGNYTITWIYDDGNGQSVSQTQSVVIDDITPPATIELDTLRDNCSVTVTAPTTQDDCKGTITGTTTNATSYSDQGTYTVQWTFDDGNGNSIMVPQVVIIDDTILPEFTDLPTDIILPTGTAFCGRNVNYNKPEFTDNCSATLTQIDGTGYTSGNAFPVGTTVQTYQVTDAGGNTITHSFNVTIVDDIAPTITNCPAPMVISTSATSCDAAALWIAPSPSDNCSGVTMTATHASGTVFPVGVATVTYIASDVNGNSNSCSFTVEVKDLVAPKVPQLPTLQGICSLTATAPTTTDNCSGTIVGTTNDPTSFSTQGTFLIHWSFTDLAGNTSTAIQTVNIQDNVAPSIPTLPVLTAECGFTYSDPAPVAQDNCMGPITGTTTNSLTYNQQGTFTINWTFNDGNGNSSTAQQQVIINDVTPPTAPTLSPIVGNCQVTVTAPTALDNCVGNVTGTTTDPLVYSTQGNYSITWKFDDGHGNTSTAIQLVSVDDNTAPTITAPSNVTAFVNTFGCVANNVNLGQPVVSDDCGIASITNNAPSSFTVGTTSVIWTVTDPAGNQSTAVQTVTINGNTFSSFDVTACERYTAPNGAVYTLSGPVIAIIPNVYGCDSIININLTVKNSSQVYKEVTACGQYVAPDGKVYKNTGTYKAIFENSIGCDSVITIKLTITTINLNVDALEDGSGLMANESNATYQWYSCDSNAIVVGATKQKFESSTSGYYSVIVDDGVCIDTSGCYLVGLGIKTPEIFTPNGDGINDLFEIEGIFDYPKSHLTIFNRWGKPVFEADGYQNDWNGIAVKGLQLGNDELPVGTYFYVIDMGDSEYPLHNQIVKGYIYLTR